MAEQNQNAELIRCIEELREKRDEIQLQIAEEEAEKNKIQQDLQVLTKRLAHVNDSLARKMSSRNEFDKIILETEAAYSKIVESSQTLLNVLKRESASIQKRQMLR
eukprot:jgi/Botrbrau1/4527/Bobra.60_2s0017.1